MTFSSVSVAGLEDLVAKLRIARREIDDFLGETTERSVRSDLRTLGLSSTGFQDLAVVQEWVDSALQETQRRLGLARVLQSQQPGAPMVQVDEDLMVLDPALAERQGRDLAIRFEQAGGVDGDISGLMEDFQALAHDPDAMAGFYAELGPEPAARLAAAMGMPESGVGENAQRYLELLSIGLGTALMDETPPDGLSELTGGFGQATDDPQVAWGRLALLQYGDFSGSPAFVEQTVNGTALDAFAAADWADPGNISAQSLGDGDTAVGLTGDIAALAFGTLARSPALATKVLTEQDISAKELTHRVYDAAGDPAQRADLADTFGLAIEAGTGSQGDPPDTEHTPEQAALAFEFITGSADHEQIPPAIKDTTARVAAAYVDEMLAGSHIDGGEMMGDRGSSMDQVPQDFPQGTGLSPDFYLSPRAVYRFLGGFQDQLEYSAPFDEAMGLYMDQQLSGAIRADPANGGGERYQSLLSLFGSLGALHYEARREFAEDFDAQERARKAALSTYVSDGLGLIPGLPHLTWWAVQKGVNLGLGAWQAASDSEADQVAAEQQQASDLRWYASVQQLVDNGALTPEQLKEAPSSLLENGQLRPIEEIFADDATRQEFYEWVNGVPALDVPADAGQDAWDSGWQGGQTFVGRA
ncbi:hypothetical protein E1212_17935 [Jiangella ureilytica]|uniref:Uncharacterized protein n=1 Tax=Jiangella ureilytica TaxID=2530374 RepID=A0A4R4RLN3_9ACTN|nr:hypothetical protein [Jiangella ureilytica]TDC49552.1 hypothetical protein E1212_17935 [Jiangella ureilytica]